MTEANNEFFSESQDGSRRVRLGSWNYDEDHYIRQYSVENDLLPINECECEYEYEYDYEYESEEGSTHHGGDSELASGTTSDSWRNEEETPAGRAPSWRRRRRQTALGKAWEIPSLHAMRRRRQFRHLVEDETLRHRRIIAQDVPKEDGDKDVRMDVKPDGATRSLKTINNNNNNNNNPRIQPRALSEMPLANISQLLRDREVYGGGSGRRGGMRSRSRCHPNDYAGRYSGFSTTKRISSFDPVFDDDDDETIMEYFTEEEDSSGNKRRRRRRRRRKGEKRFASTSPNSAKPSSPTTVTATEASDANVEVLSPPTQANGPRCPRRGSRNSSICHRSTTDQLRTYAEQVCVTKFESSYLTHLTEENQDDEEEGEEAPANATANEDDNTNNNTNNNNENENKSKAVSTISIAFSPDGKTMASTHGDHTVKITCCLTGRLLQTLVGHPRTPWTVKYHPHAGEDRHSATDNPSLSTPVTIIADGNSSTNTFSASSTNASASSHGVGTGRANAPGRRQDPSSRNSSHGEQQPQSNGGAAVPQKQQILASGCLGHQVRIWDWVTGTCLQMIRLEFAIISLSFHPSGSLLAIANGTRLHFWGLPTVNVAQEEENSSNGNRNDSDPTAGSTGIANRGNGGRRDDTQNNNNNNNNNNRGSSQNRRGTSMNIEMRHMLRCVHFLPDGKRVIVGGVNPPARQDVQRQRRAMEAGNRYTPPMSFYLRLWDFDLRAAKLLPPLDAEEGLSGRARAMEEARAAAGLPSRRRRAISNHRLFVPRALLYNDGGFDVSPDGKTLCACAEYWLPEGVDNATDLLHPPQTDDFEDHDSEYYSESCSEADSERAGSKNDVEMNDGNETSRKENVAVKEEKIKEVVMTADLERMKDASSGGNVHQEEMRDGGGDNSSARQHTSPTRPASSSLSSVPSATPPRIVVRQQQPISSPPPTFGTTAGTIASGLIAAGLVTTPIQAGLTPQTPPPNVNPLNFPLSPPSPPGRRFAGGLGRTGSRNAQALQQNEELRQQHMAHHRYGQQQQQQQQHMARASQEQQHQQVIPPTQQLQQQRVGPSSGGMGRSSGNAEVTIPAPPGINHRNHRQHRLNAQHASGAYGNPFVTASRNRRTWLQKGRYVPHVVTISLDTEPYIETVTEQVVDSTTVEAAAPGPQQVEYMEYGGTGARTVPAAASITTTMVTKKLYRIPGKHGDLSTEPHTKDRRPRLGQLLSACPLDGSKASAVTCVKFSPCTEYCLIGYGVREPHVERGSENATFPHPPYHPVTAMYKVNTGGRMRHVSTMLSGDDDVNIARFHPESGYGFVYGTKQGRIRVLGPRPWNYYNC